jgi:hypothetical protein
MLGDISIYRPFKKLIESKSSTVVGSLVTLGSIIILHNKERFA